MRIEIDTTNKKIIIKEDVLITEFMNFIKNIIGYEEYKIVNDYNTGGLILRSSGSTTTIPSTGGFYTTTS